MVNWSLITSQRSMVGCVVTLGLMVLASCQVPNPIQVDASFVVSPALSANGPTVLAVLPIEDGTAAGSVGRHLTFLRQEVNRQLIDRGYSSTTESWVDASQLGAAPVGESILTPNRLLALAKGTRDDAVLAIRIEKWDEDLLLADRRVRFRIAAAMVGNDGSQLWSGSMQGSVKAGGDGAAPPGLDASARSCAELVTRELLMRLPDRIVR